MRQRAILCLICVLCLLCAGASAAWAEPVSGDPEPEVTTQQPATAPPETTSPATTVDASVPRFMVTSFKVDGGMLTPEKRTLLTVELKNMSVTKPIRNIKLSFTDETGGVTADGTGTQFVQSVNPNGVYTWTIAITASKSAPMGEHHLVVSSEYEDPYYAVYKSADTLSVTVSDVPLLAFEGLMLPQTVVAGAADAFTVKIANTGKAVVRNVRVEVNVPGVNTGGVVFVGEIPAGEQREAVVRFNVDGKAGQTEGDCRLIYDDEFGKSYELKQTLQTRIVPEEPASGDGARASAGGSVGWMLVFGAVCLLIGGAIGFLLKTVILNYKARKGDQTTVR